MKNKLTLGFRIFRFLHEWLLDQSNKFGEKCYGAEFIRNITRRQYHFQGATYIEEVHQYDLSRKALNKLTAKDIEDMTSDVYKQRFLEPGFRELVNKFSLQFPSHAVNNATRVWTSTTN